MITGGLYLVSKEYAEIDKVCKENNFSLFVEPSYDGFETFVLKDNKNPEGRDVKFDVVSGQHNLASRMLVYINKEISDYNCDSKFLEESISSDKYNRLEKVTEGLLKLEKEFSNTYIEETFKITSDATVNLEQQFLSKYRKGYQYNGESFSEISNQLKKTFETAFKNQQFQYSNCYYFQNHYILFDMEKKSNSDRDFIGIGKSPYKDNRGRYDFDKNLVLHFCLQKKDAETLANVLSNSKVFSELGIQFAEQERVDSFIKAYGSKEEIKGKDRPTLKPKSSKTNHELDDGRN